MKIPVLKLVDWLEQNSYSVFSHMATGEDSDLFGRWMPESKAVEGIIKVLQEGMDPCPTDLESIVANYVHYQAYPETAHEVLDPSLSKGNWIDVDEFITYIQFLAPVLRSSSSIPESGLGIRKM